MAYKFLDSTGLAHVFTKIKILLNTKADNDHTHQYAGSASVGGAANSALKLENARTINGVSFDGTKNISIDTGVTSVNDSTGAVIIKDYVTSLSVNGKTITYNKKDGTSGTITTQDTTYSAATTSTAGLMSASDKTKLNGIAEGANKYTLPAATASTLGGVKIGSNISNSSGTISLTKDNVTNALGYTPPTDSTATTSADGLMSADDKTKLNGIAAGAEVNVQSDWNATSGDALILNKPSIPSKTSDLTNDSGYITSSDIPEGAAASTTTPKMDGTAAVGTEMAFARGDHTHPTDTSRVPVTRKVNGKALSADITIDVGTPIVAATSSDGVAYTGTVDGVTALTVGMTITIVPDKTSTSIAATLNINSLGAKYIRQCTTNSTATAFSPAKANWLVANKPITVQYDGEYWRTIAPRTNASDMAGTVAIANGGTGATTAAAALTNLGAAPAYEYSTTDLTAGTSALETGKIYIVYE